VRRPPLACWCLLAGLLVFFAAPGHGHALAQPRSGTALGSPGDDTVREVGPRAEPEDLDLDEPAVPRPVDPPRPVPRAGPTRSIDDFPSGSAFEVPRARRLDPYGPRPEGVARLSLQQIIRFALENPLIAKAQAEVAIMESQLKKARFAWVPVVETTMALSPGVNVRCDDISLDDGSPDGFDFQWCRPPGEVDVQRLSGYLQQLGQAGVRFRFDATTIIPITGFGKLMHLRRAAEAGVAVRKLEKLAVQQETVMRVHQAFSTLMLARESIEILREANDIVGRAQSRVEEDLGGEDDWAADVDDIDVDRDPDDLFRVQLAAIEIDRLMRQALKIESLALSALWALAGRAAPPGFDVTDQRLERERLSGTLLPVTEYKAIALRERPEARMATAAVRAREAQERLARAMFLPDLGIVLGLDLARSSAADPSMRTLYYIDSFNYSRLTAALALRWRWDFHNKAFDLQGARATRQSAESQREASRLLLGREVEEAYADLIEAHHAIESQRRAADIAWRLVVSQEQKDTVGGGDSFQLLRALETWYRRRFDYIEAIGTYNQALAALSRAVGTPLAEP
jgi:outer membrane protein TolC